MAAACLLAALLAAAGAPAEVDTLAPATPAETIDGMEGEREDPELFERLAWLQEHPLDLNLVSREELLTLPGISPADADAVIAGRRKRGRYASVREILALEPGGERIYRAGASYLAVQPAVRSEPFGLEARSRGTRDLRTEPAAETPPYDGDLLRGYTRLTARGGRFEGGVVAEKDPGEAYGAGFVAGYLAAHDLGPVALLLAGDFDVEWGEGLVFWRGAAPGRGADAVTAALRSGTGIRPHRSSEEYDFLRGAAAALRVPLGAGTLGVTALWSRRSLSGSSEDPAGPIAPYEEGLFRTAQESARRGSFTESLVGGRVAWELPGVFRAGVSGFTSGFSRPVIPSGGVGRAFDRLAAGGVDASLTAGRITLFGEAAASRAGGEALAAGATLSLPGGSAATLAYRSFDPDYVNTHAGAFGERSDTRNERGWYAGLRVPVARGLALSAYLDHFSFPSATALVPFPWQGFEMSGQMEAAVGRGAMLTLRGSYRRTEQDAAVIDGSGRTVTAVEEVRRFRLRAMLAVPVSRALRLRTRIEGTGVAPYAGKGREEGIVAVQEAGWTPGAALALDARIALFDTDSYDTRLYAVESDVAGAYANPPLYGRGIRWYLVARFRPAGGVSVSAKYAETAASAGGAESFDSRLTLQVDIRL